MGSGGERKSGRVLSWVPGWPWEIYSDARHACEQGWTQVLRVQALADLMILALFFTSLGYRLAFYTAATSAEYATSRPQAGVTAGRFGVQAVLEAFLLAFCLFRVVYFLRVNRHVFIIWRSLARGLSLLCRLLPLLLLLFLGFQVLGMAVGNRDRQCSRSLGSMAGCVLLLISGDLRIAELQRGESLRIIYVILVCVVGRLVVANAWLSVLMQKYHTVRVEAGFSSQTYRWKENDWVRYILPWPLDKLYLKIRSLHMPFSGLVQRFQK